MEVQAWPIDKIKINERIRQNLGNLDDLKRSMTERGLINPIGITPDGVLVTGERRLSAARELDWITIDARIYYGDPGDLELLDVEAEENLCRKQLTVTEAEKRYIERRKLLAAEAKKRQGARTDLSAAPEDETAGQELLPKFGRSRGEEPDAKAAKDTGFSHTTLDKVTKIRELVEGPDTHPIVREEAARQYQALVDGKITAEAATRAIVNAKARAKRHTPPSNAFIEDPQGQWLSPPPRPTKPLQTLTQQVIDAINKGRGMSAIAAEINDDLDLSDDHLKVLRQRLAVEIKERRTLDRALKAVEDKRKVNKK